MDHEEGILTKLARQSLHAVHLPDSTSSRNVRNEVEAVLLFLLDRLLLLALPSFLLPTSGSLLSFLLGFREVFLKLVINFALVEGASK